MMGRRGSVILAGALLCLAATASWADLAPYTQDFEGLDQGNPGALAGDGWLVFANVFSPDGTVYYYGYGPFPAPNGGAGFSGIDIGQGGPAQGDQQLVVYNDYNNGDHGNGFLIEANVFQEQIIGAADAGSTWLFEFDAKRGNIEPDTTALAFIKTLDPNAGYALTRFFTVDTTNLPDAWGSFSISIFIDPDLVGQILQIGFLNTTTFYTPSGVFYDNINFELVVPVSLDIKPGSCPNPLNVNSRGDLPVAILGTADLDAGTIDPASIRLAGVAPLRSDYEDVGTPFDPYLGREDCEFDCHEMEGDGWMDLTFKFDTQELAAALGGADGECIVVGMTGNFWPAYGGGRILGEDVVVILDRAATTRTPTDGVIPTIVDPADIANQPIKRRR
jgi:hypothetical protein